MSNHGAVKQVSGYQTNHGLVGGSGSSSSYGGGNSRGLAAATNSSVLRSINDILREDRDYLHRSRSAGGGHLYDYSNASPTRRYMSYGAHSRGASPARSYSGVPTEEERSMERLASTFRTEDYTSSLYERLHDFSPLASDPELGVGGDYNTGPTAMPLLPDMPSRSRKLLEDLAASANDAPTMHIQSRGKYGAHGAHSTSRYLSPRWSSSPAPPDEKQKTIDYYHTPPPLFPQNTNSFLPWWNQKTRFGAPPAQRFKKKKIFWSAPKKERALDMNTHVRSLLHKKKIYFETKRGKITFFLEKGRGRNYLPIHLYIKYL